MTSFDSNINANNSFNASCQKVLIITYYWPPGSGAGVQRWLKFAKYLPQFGWEPVILTVEPLYASYPATDVTLENDIPAGTKVYKTQATNYFTIYRKARSGAPAAGFASGDDDSLKAKIMRFIRGNFFIPDPRKGWNNYAFSKACDIIQAENIKHVITTSPPHSTQLIGLKLKKKFTKLKWIADLRDPWTDIYYYDQFFHTYPAKKIDKSYELNVLINADRIITVGNSLKDIFIKKFPAAREKTEVLTNGYDEEDFRGIKRVDPEKFTISYIGTLSDAYPIGSFLTAFRKSVDAGNDLYLRFVGTVSRNQREQILSKAGKERIEFIPYVSHNEAVRYMMSSSVLLLVIPDHHSNKSIITGKLFEYIATGLPILCLGPADGDAAGIISDSGSGLSAAYDESEKIFKALTEKKGGTVVQNITGKEKYSRFELTCRLASLLTEI